jgi:hypothetical protein
MARPRRSMSGQLVALQRGFGPESQKDTGLANLEENVTAMLLVHDPQTENRRIEFFRRLEIVDVDGGFDDGFGFH